MIRHDNAGKPVQETMVGRLNNGSRALAVIDEDSDGLLLMEKIKLVGKQDDVLYGKWIGKNMARFKSLRVAAVNGSFSH